MSSEQLNTAVENVAEEVKTTGVEETTNVVEETVVASEAAVEEVATEATEDRKSKTKSFFSIFKKDDEVKEEEPSAVEAAAETTEATSEEAVAEGEAAATEEVPVESSPAKKGRLCGLCALGKKSSEDTSAETEAPAETTESAEAPAEVVETEPVVEAPVDEAPVESAESAEATDAAAVAAATEAPAESSEGEAVTEPAVEADIVRSGVLYKSGKYIKSRLNERHCRIFSNGVFQWSKTADFSKAHECTINAETTTVAFLAEGENAPHKYRMEIHCCGGVATCGTDTEEDRDEWIRAIETVKESVTASAAAATSTEEAAEEVAAE